MKTLTYVLQVTSIGSAQVKIGKHKVLELLFAAPFVSGTVALMLAVNPCLSNDDINHILKVTSVNVDALNPNYIGLIGEGRLNAAAAVEMAAGYNAFYLNTNYSLSCGTYGGEIDVNVQGGMHLIYTNGQTDPLLQVLWIWLKVNIL